MGGLSNLSSLDGLKGFFVTLSLLSLLIMLASILGTGLVDIKSMEPIFGKCLHSKAFSR